MPPAIHLRVNGETRRLDIPPDTPLLYVLRNDLGLKAAKFGCGLEQCGACKVLIDGVARPSCATAVSQVQDAEITTLEGLGSLEEPSPLQRAFIAEQAAQCGYCTAGLLVASQALLAENPHPTRQEICRALEVHVCRCGSHNRVIRAVQRAARETQA